MNLPPDHIEDLIASYLTGEASAEETAFVEEWTNRDERNRRYFEDLKLIFKRAASVPIAEPFDTDKAWEKLREKLSQKKQGRTLLFNPPSHYKLYWRIAAGILVLLTVGIFTYNYFKERPAESLELVAGQNTEADTLPDGSAVFLNRRTKVEYSYNTKRHFHRAKLRGEAYFNINHNDGQTFVVEADGTFIKDIGTSFNVKAYPDSSTVEVVVEEGEVMFYAEGNPGIYLRKNGKGIYNKITKTFTTAEPERNVTAYKTKFFSFSNDSLASVVETLNDVYDAKIRIGENLKGCRLTVSFNDEDIDEISNIIAETLGLTVSRSGDVIFLKGPGCGGTKHE